MAGANGMGPGRCLLLSDEQALERMRVEGGRAAGAIRHFGADIETYARLHRGLSALAVLDRARVEALYAPSQDASSVPADTRLQFSDALLDTTVALLWPLPADPAGAGFTADLEAKGVLWRTLIEQVGQDQRRYAHREGSTFVLILVLLGELPAEALGVLEETVRRLGFDRCYLMNHIIRGQRLYLAGEVWPALVARLLLRLVAERPSALKGAGGLWVWRAFELILDASERAHAEGAFSAPLREVREAVLSAEGGKLPELVNWLEPIGIPQADVRLSEPKQERRRAIRDWLAVQAAEELRDWFRDRKRAAAEMAGRFRVKASQILYDDPPRVTERIGIAWHRIHEHPAVMQTAESQTAAVTGPDLQQGMKEATAAWEKLREKDEALAELRHELEGCASELERAQAGFVGVTPRIIIAAVVVLALGYAAFIGMEALSGLLLFPSFEHWLAPVAVAACALMGAVLAAAFSFFAECRSGRRAAARWPVLIDGLSAEFRQRSELALEAVVASHRVHQRILEASGVRNLRELSVRTHRLVLRHFCSGESAGLEAPASEKQLAEADPGSARALLQQETVVSIQTVKSHEPRHGGTVREANALAARFLDVWREFAAREDPKPAGAFPAVPLWNLLRDGCRRLQRRLELAAVARADTGFEGTFEALERQRRAFEESSDYLCMSWPVESLGREGIVTRHLLAVDAASAAQRSHWISLPLLGEPGLLGVLFDEAPVEFAGVGEAATRPRVRKK